MADPDGVLFLNLLNVYAERFDDSADLVLSHQTLSDRRVVRNVDTSKRLKVTGLFAVPQGLYRLEVDPLGYLPLSQFVNVNSDKGTALDLTFPVDPKKVSAVEFPEFADLPDQLQALLQVSDEVLGYEDRSGSDLYGALDAIRKAGMLNIAAKCRHTILPSGRSVLDYLQKLNECRGDRFFVNVPKQLREDTKNSMASGLFFEVPELLHRPPDGYSEAGSYKTSDHFGNLQLSFFCNGADWVADIDIDDAGGLEHLFQVLRNALENRATHPYDIHEILIFHQKIDPGYRLLV
jgi:hypothetical protein